MAKWGPTSWLVLVRCLQALGALISAGLNGFLLVYIHVNALGLSQVMFALEIMICVVLIYTAIVLLIQHTGRRRLHAKTSLVVTFVVGDVILNGLMIGVLSMLSRAGVPSNCAGLTRSDIQPGDATYAPPPGYSTIRFGTGSGDDKGVLDKFCALERGYYFISVAISLFYTATVTLSILRIYERLYVRKSDADLQLLTAHELGTQQANKLTKSQTRGSSGGFQSSSPISSPPQDSSVSPISSRSIHHQPFPSQPREPVMPVSPIISPIITIDPAREGLLIGQSAADHAAEAAMVTDGYRNRNLTHSGMPPLPPYTPGESSRFMAGHGHESNEMRLSDYTKGQTRAQNMKDAGA